MAETVIYEPGQNQANTVPAWMAMNNGGLFGNGNWGSGIVGFLAGLLFGNWGGFGGWGNGFGGGSAGAGFLSNQINNDSGRELLMNAINSNGEASRSAIQNLATMLGQDFNLVNSGVQTIESALSSLALQQAVSVPQIINSIQAGDASLASQFAQCCCNAKLLITEQGYQNQIATLNQTNQLGSQADRNTNAIIGAINAQTVAINDQFCAAKERDMQAKIDTQADIITQLRGQISNDRQTEQFNAAFNVLNAKITELAAKTPQTVPVTWPNLQAVNVTPYVNGGYYGNAWGYSNGVSF